MVTYQQRQSCYARVTDPERPSTIYEQRLAQTTISDAERPMKDRMTARHGTRAKVVLRGRSLRDYWGTRTSKVWSPMALKRNFLFSVIGHLE